MQPKESVKSSPLSREDVRHYEEQGYLFLRGVLNPSDLATMLDECMQAWNNEKGGYDPAGTWLHNALLPDIHHQSTAVRGYYNRGPLVDVAEQLIGPNIKGATSQLTFKMRGNTKPFGWHQDNGYGQLEPANALTTLTALDDTDEENGCLWIIPGSHRQGQIDVSDRLTPEAKAAGIELSIEVSNAAEAIPVELRAGDAVVFHCHLLHRSEGNFSQSRDRRVLFLRYADADAVEVYNNRRPRLGPLLRGVTQFSEVAAFERELVQAGDRQVLNRCSH
jgi:hypothetical protein